MQDGVRFHDVGCSHEKSVICESLGNEAADVIDKQEDVFIQDKITEGNHLWQDKMFLLSWKLGLNNLTWEEADSFCQKHGMELVILNQDEKIEHFFKQVVLSILFCNNSYDN